MVEIRVHGRDGRGVVTAADLMAYAVFVDGYYARAFPSFGSERTGAPVVSYCRIEDREIRSCEPILQPDVVIVQDPTPLVIMNPFSGLKPGGYALVSSRKSPHELGLDKVVSSLPEGHFRTMPATEIAIEILGRPMPNAVMLGGLTSLTGIVKLDSVSDAIRERFKSEAGNLNVEAAAVAYKYLEGEEEKIC